MVTRTVREDSSAHAPSLISNQPSIHCHLVYTSGYHSMANGHFTTNGNPNRQGGLFSTRSIAHQQPTINPLLPRLHVGLPLHGQRPPQPMVTRTVREDSSVHAPSLISNQPSVSYCFVDTSGYHSMAAGHFTTNGNPNRQGGLFSTRSIAHQQSTISQLLPR